jgi:hypothetical protein
MNRDITDANGSSPKQDAGGKKKSKKKMRKQIEAEGGKQTSARTLDGLIVEDLSTVHKDAKMASTGSKVATFSP